MATSTLKHMPGLDALRGLAISSVLLHNIAWNVAWHHDPSVWAKVLSVIANAGWLGVQLFFVISGFLITGILLNEKDAPHRIRNFYMRRTLRIFPLYYVSLFIIVVLLPVSGAIDGRTLGEPRHLIWYWLYLANWTIPTIGGPGILSHFWSLSVEEQFYLFWPMIVFATTPRRLQTICFLLVVIALASRWYLVQQGLEFARWRAYEFTFARWDALALGALLAVTVRDRAHRSLKRYIVWTAWSCGVYVVGQLMLTHGYEPVGEGFINFNQTIAALWFASLIYLVVEPSTETRIRLLARVTGSRFLQMIGKYSYAIYVVHIPLLFAGSKIFQPGSSLLNVSGVTGLLLTVGIVAICSFMLALISWQLLEQPFLKLRRFFYAGTPNLPREYAARAR